MVNVPAQYDALIQEMSSATGLPYSVIAAQANDESAFNATARSSAGAEGWLQFLPSTYDTYAAQAGVGSGTEFNPADESKVYDVYMSTLLKQEGGSVKKALAAYNAGPGNLSAGMGYANKIIGEAGQAGSITTTGINVPGAIGGAIGGGLSISGILGNVFGDLRDVFERFGLILLGAALILLGIHILSDGGGGSTTNNITETASGAAAPTKGKHTKALGTGATEAAEAAAVA
jgi:hypothetical protein